MDIHRESDTTPELRVVTEAMAVQAATEIDEENVAIARLLIGTEELGISGITVVGPSGTYRIEPPAAGEQNGAHHVSRITELRRRVAKWVTP
jgi:hypothetical protein